MPHGKIVAPRLVDHAVPRRGLLARLEAARGARIMVVTGAAGSGKSTLVYQWVAQLESDCPVAWLTLDAGDNNPTRFWSRFSDALLRACPTLSWRAGASVAVSDVELLLQELIDRQPRVVVVFDDLQFVMEEGILRLVEVFAAGVGSDMRLVLVSRAQPALHLARRVAAGDVIHIRGEDLFFSAEETRAVMLGGAAPSGAAGLDLLARVQEFTGGWPVAVGLTARLARIGGGLTAREMHVARRDLADYLTEEVLAAQSADVQQFLLDVAVLDEITVEAANSIRESTDAAKYLDYLERNEVFLTGLDELTVATWRLHSVVRDCLRGRRQSEQPGRWRALQRRAALYYANSDLERAMAHSLAAADYGLAADLLDDRTADISTSQYVDGLSLLRWLEAMPDDVVASRPELRARGITVARFYRRFDLYGRWMRKRPPQQPGGLDQFLLEADAAESAGDACGMSDAARAGLERCEPGSRWALDFHSALCLAEELLGNWQAAVKSLRKIKRVLSVTPPSSLVNQEAIRAAIAVDLARAGDRDGCRAALAELQGWLDEATTVGYTSAGLVQWAQAMAAYYSGDYAAADTTWTTPPDDLWTYGQPLIKAIYQLDLTRVRRAAGKHEAARAALAELQDSLEPFVAPGRMPEWAAEEETLLQTPASAAPHAPRERSRTPQSVDPLSEREMQILRLLRSEFSAPEIASHLCISYNTVKTHTRALYRKLEATTRSEAVRRAISSGYLSADSYAS